MAHFHAIKGELDEQAEGFSKNSEDEAIDAGQV
jgi:hypothetical protein